MTTVVRLIPTSRTSRGTSLAYEAHRGTGKMGLTANIRESMPQTFGENIFELYRNSFFLKDGLIGYFAQRCITIIDRKLDKKDLSLEELKEIEKMIAIIGDDRLKMYFFNRIRNLNIFGDIDLKIAVLQQEIESLKKMKSDQQRDTTNE